MNVSSYLQDISLQLARIPPSSYPAILWNNYTHYLWYYQPNSWVARIASFCRVLAVLVGLPIVILALLDISSYGIARTLGIIDDVKASTSDRASLHQDAPSILVQDSSLSPSDSPFSDSDREMGSSTEHILHNNQLGGTSKHQSARLGSADSLGASQPQAFYTSDSGNLKLSGVGVFSPATSRPPSPVMTRRNMQSEGKTSGLDQDAELRQRTKQGVDD